jgi:hypothetical protein
LNTNSFRGVTLRCSVVELLVREKGKEGEKERRKKGKKERKKRELSSQVSMNSFRGVTLRCANVYLNHLGE